MRGRRGPTYAATLLVGALAGCSGSTDRAEDVEVRGDWAFVSGAVPSGDLVPPARELPTLTFDSGGEAGGHTGCNAYGASVTQEGTVLSFGPVSQTLMGCEGAVGTFEERYVSALSHVGAVSRTGDVLTLRGDGVVLRFQPVPAWPEDAIVERTWRLHALTDDRSGVRVPAGHRDGGRADPAMLYLSAGRITATTGCRSLRGRWVESSGVVVLTESAYRGTCGPEPSAQEVTVTHVLSRFTAEVGFRSGQQELVLTAAVADADGIRRQLVYRG